MSDSFRSTILAFVAFAFACVAQQGVASEPTGSMSIPRAYHTASHLPDGRILIAGGRTIVGNSVLATASAEIYDPTTGSFIPTGSMALARSEHAAARLPGGRILVVGGRGNFESPEVTSNSAEIYDPVSGTWAPTGRMFDGRPDNPIALTLIDGKVLVLSGNNSGTAELYDPAIGAFTGTPGPVFNRFEPAAVVLADGRVLAAGGNGSGQPPFAALRDPVTGLWEGGAIMNFRRGLASATLLANGTVLVAGGLPEGAGPAEIFDPATRSFSVTGSTAYPRINHVASPLADGSVIVTGSFDSFNMDVGTDSIERYDPALGTWSLAGTMNRRGDGHTATLLANGNVLIAGGLIANPETRFTYVATAELFVPACASADYTSSISPSSLNVSGSGGTGTVAVTYQPGCRWTVNNVPSWITITSGESGHGNGTVTFSVARNAGEWRESVGFRIAGREFRVTQQQDPCASATPSVSPSSLAMDAAGGTRTLAVTQQSGCPWAVTNIPSWITFPAGSTGAGNANIQISIAANPGAARSAELFFGTRGFTVTQAANRCALVGALQPGVTQSGTLSSTDCIEGARGSQYYTDRYYFDAVAGQRLAVELSSPAFDTYLYVRGPNGAVILSDDNGGHGNNSRLPPNGGFFRVPNGAGGQYVIEVTSRYQRATGAYSLLLTER